jgi:methionyl-tRNA synthetase
MTNKYFDGKVTAKEFDDEFDKDLIATAKESIEKYHSLMDIYRNADAVNAVMNLAKRCNKYIDETMPWALAKDEEKKGRLGTVLYSLLEGIRFIAVLLKPFMPETSDKILEQIGTDVNTLESLAEFGATKVGAKVGVATPLFSRLDVEKTLAEIEASLPAPEAEEEEKEIIGLAEIQYDDFAKVELRVCKVVDCQPIKKAKKLLQLTLDDGTKEPRTVASGIAKWYKPEDLIGKSVIVVANLAPRTLCGVESHGMILAGEITEDDIKVAFVEGLPAGTMLS